MTQVARETLGIADNKKRVLGAEDKTFRGFFGAPIAVIANIWNRIEPNLEDAAKPKHLLWSLVFLKIYATEDVHCRIVGWPDRNTFRKWQWYFVEKIAELKEEIILLDNRFADYPGDTNCLMSVDGTDCPVMEPWPFDPQWYSHKFNGPGVKYELGVCIATGFIVWVNGPFHCGVGDSTIFKGTLSGLLAEDEGVEVDGGYKGDASLKNPNVNRSRVQRQQKATVRARHETVNGRLKQFNVLNIAFRHLKPRNEMMPKHRLCFNAVAVITQLKFETGERPFDVVEYDTNYR